MKKKPGPKKNSPKGIASPIEAVKDLGYDLAAGATKDLAGGMVADAFRQITGPLPETGFRQERSLPSPEQQPQTLVSTEQKAIYIGENKREVTYRTSVILTKIKQLAQETQGLQKELGNFTLEETPDDAGEYHLSFFDRILNLIEKARQSIHEAATCLAIWNTRRQKKGLLAGYGHGKGKKSVSAGIHKMLGGEMGASRAAA